MFYQRELPFLGHIVSAEGIKPDPEKVEAIRQLPPPRNKSELRTFLGMIAYVKRFIPECSTLTAPLSALTGKDTNFDWTPIRDYNFRALKEKLMTAPILQYPLRDGDYQMETDASDAAIGGVLRILTEQGYLPVAYESRKLTDGECRYPIHDKEMLAMVHCLYKWRCYLERQKEFVALTDHKSLIYLKTQANLSRRQAAWMETLQRYPIRIEYKPGTELKFADALSRLYIRRSVGTDDVDPDWPLLVMRNKNEAFPADTTDATKAMVLKHEDEFANVHGTLHRKLTEGNTAAYVPVSQRVDTILRYHRDLGHTRARNLYEFLKVRCWWSSMRADIEEVLRQCEICEKFASTHAPPKSVIPVTVKEPFSTWAIDVVGPMPTPKNNTHCKKYIITAVEYVTRWTVAQAVVNHTGKDIRRFIGKEIVSKFGAPKLLITDGGPKLVANATKVYLAKQGIGQNVTTPYHPQANGRVKRLNGSLTQALAKLTADNPLAWAQHLPTALMVCRVRVNRGTGVSPYKAVFGTDPVFNSTGTVPKLIIPEQVPPRTHPNIKRVMEDMPESEAKRVRESAIPLQGRFDVGDEVWVLNTDHSKLQPEKLGPAVVVVVHPNNTYTVKGLDKKYPNRT